MDTKKHPPFSKMVLEVLAADESKELNAKTILRTISEKYLVDADKTNLELVCHELEQGKTSGEFLQTKGKTAYGYFKFNPKYVPPVECKEKVPPSYADPPLQKECLPVQEAPKNTKGKPMKKTVDDQDEFTPFPIMSDFMCQQSVYNNDGTFVTVHADGTIETGHFDNLISGLSLFPNAQKKSTAENNPLSNPKTVEQLMKIQKVCGFNGPLGMISEQLLEANKRLNEPQPSTSNNSSKSELSNAATKKETGKEQKFQKKSKKVTLDIDDSDDDCVPNTRVNIKSNEVAEKSNNAQFENEKEVNLAKAKKWLQQASPEEREEVLPKLENLLQNIPEDICLSKTEGTEAEPETLLTISRAIQNPTFRIAVLHKNPLSEFVKRVKSENLLVSTLALNCLTGFWRTEPQTQQIILNENIGKVLLDLLVNCDFTTDIGAVILVNSFTLIASISRRLPDGGVSISETEFGNLMRAILIYADQKNADKWAQIHSCIEQKDAAQSIRLLPVCLYNFMEYSEKFYANFDMPEEKITQLFALMKSVPNIKDKHVFFQVFTRAMKLRPDQLEMLTNANILDVLATYLGKGKGIDCRFIECVYLIVNKCKNGAKIVFDAGLVDKILPYISSKNEQFRVYGTIVIMKLGYQFPSIREHIHSKPSLLNQMNRNISEFNLYQKGF